MQQEARRVVAERCHRLSEEGVFAWGRAGKVEPARATDNR